MKIGHWVVLVSVSAFIITVYMTMFRSVPIITTQLVSTVRMFSSTAPPKEDFDPQSLESVKNTDPFKTKKMEVTFKEFSCATPVPSSLPLKLISTSVLADNTKSLAVVASPGLGTIEIREGQKINEQIEVYQINRMQVLLKNFSNNSCEIISLVAF